jgi:hypothetical protein
MNQVGRMTKTRFPIASSAEGQSVSHHRVRTIAAFPADFATDAPIKIKFMYLTLRHSYEHDHETFGPTHDEIGFWGRHSGERLVRNFFSWDGFSKVKINVSRTQ